jgi:large subunit ribosomal protein L23
MSPTKETAAAKKPAKTKTKGAGKTPAKPRTKAAPRTPGKTPAPRFRPERLMTLLLAPTVSEKATQIADRHSQFVFRVVQDATKPEVKAAVELLFKVDVEAVQIANVKGKAKRFGAFSGRRRHWKKAYVSLKPGQEINFAQEG